ncbi:hypothetical protein HYV31_00755 [candidate division WWE3 bacterium]|nr:hypothetical protein [candidate division WWE3 bacterium]
MINPSNAKSKPQLSVSEINILLSKTGWQSWSGSTKFKLPTHDFPPSAYTPKIFEMPEITLKPSAVGWSSWPVFGTNINEGELIKQLIWLKNNPDIKLEYILLDDGWALWGDWFDIDRKNFQMGLNL